jgi:hypothetical protein
MQTPTTPPTQDKSSESSRRVFTRTTPILGMPLPHSVRYRSVLGHCASHQSDVTVFCAGIVTVGLLAGVDEFGRLNGISIDSEQELGIFGQLRMELSPSLCSHVITNG